MEPSPDPAAPPVPKKPWVLPLVLAVAAAFGVTLWAVTRRSGDGEPAPAGPTAAAPKYPNTAPGVRYVGDRACARCHHGHFESYRRHPMGRSLAAVADADPPDPGGPLYSFEAEGSSFRVERRGGRVFHEEVYRRGGKELGRLREEVRFVVGSGAQGRSYLVERDGFLFVSPISWYAHKEGHGWPAEWFAPWWAWDVSPGFEGKNFLHFNRAVTANCLFCHADNARPVEGTANRYHRPLFAPQAAIGCERCHGPGELHVKSRVRGDIINPAKLEPDLREAVCQQCHLQGEVRFVRRGRKPFDYRPGLPLRDFWAVFLLPPRGPDSNKAVSHVEQMQVSRCFRKSRGAGQLGCISCHDPHQTPDPETRVAYYRGRCLECHAEAAGKTRAAAPPCGEASEVRRRRSPEDSCIDCHMPRRPSTNIAHSAVTDHRIVRRPDRPPRVPQRLGPDGIPLVPFFAEEGRPDRELSRDLGLAMVDMARRPGNQPNRPVICGRALPLLEEAVERDPDDAAAWDARAYALWAQDRPQEAFEAVAKTLNLAPQSEGALAKAVGLAIDLGRLDAALAYGRHLLRVNPWDPAYHALMARALALGRHWPQAVRECRQSLRLDPANLQARAILVECHLKAGDKKQARAELQVLLALEPPNADRLREVLAELGE